MKKAVFLKQPKPIIGNILGVFILILTLFLLYEGTAGLSQVTIMFFSSLVLIGYSISFEITSDLNHRKHFRLFGNTVFKQSLDCIPPDYVTVFYSVFKKESEWGPVAAMGSQIREGNFVVRFFKGKAYFTVWRTDSMELANAKAVELGKLLNVEVKLKN